MTGTAYYTSSGNTE